MQGFDGRHFAALARGLDAVRHEHGVFFVRHRAEQSKGEADPQGQQAIELERVGVKQVKKRLVA